MPREKKVCACPGPMHRPPCAIRNIGGAEVDFSEMLSIFKNLEDQAAKDSLPRDPKRISALLKRLEKIWRENPDLRLWQLFHNATDGNDYYLEDEALMKKLEKFYKKSRSF